MPLLSTMEVDMEVVEEVEPDAPVSVSVLVDTEVEIPLAIFPVLPVLLLNCRG